MDLEQLSENLTAQLRAHENRSTWRFEELSKLINQPKESEMGDGINTDRVTVNAGGGSEGGGGGFGGAAMAAALLNGRNQDSAIGPLLMAMGGRRDDGGLLGGGGLLAGLLLGSLVGGRRGGGLFGGGGDDCGGDGAVNQLTLTQVLSKLGSIEGAIPLAACNTDKTILAQTNELQNQTSQALLATLAAISGSKDATQNALTVLLNDNSKNTQAILSAVAGVATKIDANVIMDLQRQLGVAEARAAEERNGRNIDANRVEVNQTVRNEATAVAAQSQFQTQTQAIIELRELCRNLSGDIQAVRQSQSNINFGTQAGVGQGQAATNNRV